MTASVCGAMDEHARDKISKAFAGLTGLLEDAAGYAVDGQSLQRPPAALREIVAQIRPLLTASELALGNVEHTLNGGRESRGP